MYTKVMVFYLSFIDMSEKYQKNIKALLVQILFIMFMKKSDWPNGY